MQTKNKNYNVGVVVGRFQVHSLHPGHVELLDWVQNNHDTMIVVLGNSPVLNRSNPLPFNARRLMIQEAYPNALIVPLSDKRYDHTWSAELDTTVARVIRPTETVCLYGSRDGFIPHYKGQYNTQELVGTGHFWSGTEVRQKIANKAIGSADFRAGVIYASNGDYPRVIPTVDAVVFEGADIVMVRKNGEDRFRFPGGYVEPGSTFETSIKREIKEEVGDLEVELEYLGNMNVQDWRYKGQNDTIHTTVFKATKLWGRTGSFTDRNEIAEVKNWTPTNLRLGYKTSIVEEHWPIVELLIEKDLI